MDTGADVDGDGTRTGEIRALDALNPGDVSADLVALVELAARVCEVSGGALNIITEDAQHQIAAVGADPSVCTAEESMCAVVLDQPTVAVGDARLDPRLAGNPFVDGRRDRIRFYASTPLLTPQGVTIGRLCVFDPEPRELDGEQEDALAMLAERVMDVLELRRRTRQLERSNERLSEFATQVSHDLRSPLSALMLYVEMARDEPEVTRGSLIETMLDRGATVGRRMTALIEGILRNAQQEVTPERKPVDLGVLLDAVLGDLAAVVRAGEARVTRGRLDVVAGDEALLHSLLLNLVTNALKFTRPGVPARVEVRSYPEDDDWVIEVCDEGRGVPERDRERVFERFDRGSAVQDTDGHGVGLATVRRVVEIHGGTVTLLPNGPQGTVARVRIPARSVTG